ncbi:hypothetical protein [Pseudoxanthomonas sacheonensis]|uniref:Acetyltransferase n=1 Tax=Pseudoxanthomonas sacheonensis TaxID=443615 RepID=A0ABU1RP90_9GAMM|nr:hypothetical protein [Pseudoxanthomonas sacheonensis]MDR6840592.1 putative acetyltransferase [Pseudoxanthomonas sacheonensis]
MDYPNSLDPKMVGEYPALAKAGGGYFFDHVLEYRVWCHPDPDAPDDEDGSDYYYAFESYSEALEFSKSTALAEEPLALIRQLEWIDEPKQGTYIHERGERIAEWRAEWLSRGSRTPGAIEAFIRARSESNA